MPERQIDRGRNASVSEERQSLDEVLVDVHVVRSSRLHAIDRVQRERLVEGNALARGSH